MVYINDLPEVVSFSIKIFEDDTKLYCSVITPDDVAQLQNDINALTKWSKQWQLAFNENKCSSLHIGPRNPEHSYMMKGTMLASTSIEKNLGIHADSELKFRKQASSAVPKATQIMSLICRSFQNINEHTLPLVFKTLVRPHLEYANLIWGRSIALMRFW